MKEALKLALEALELVSIEFVCNGAHHAKKDRHDWSEPCPIVERYQAAITAIKEALVQPPEPRNFCPRCGERERAMRENAYVQDEREACAKMAEELNDIGHSYGLEDRIRARGNT